MYKFFFIYFSHMHDICKEFKEFTKKWAHGDILNIFHNMLPQTLGTYKKYIGSCSHIVCERGRLLTYK